MKKTKISVNKPIYLRLSILEISKIIMYEFWYDYVKPKYGEKSEIMLHGYRQLHSLHENKTFTQMFKQDLILEIIN